MNPQPWRPDEGDRATIDRALYVVADTRIIDLAQILRVTTSEAAAFRERCWNLYEARTDAPPDGAA